MADRDVDKDGDVDKDRDVDKEKQIRIGVVAPSCRLDTSVPDRVKRLAADLFASRAGGAPTLDFHDQCFLSAGHFAGTD